MFLQKLENNVDILESFKNSISGYVNWWTRMDMSMNQQAGSIEELSQKYSGERNKKVVAKWEQISDDFRKYTDRVSRSPHCFFNFESVTRYIPLITRRQMHQLQDQNHDIFAQLKIESKEN